MFVSHRERRWITLCLIVVVAVILSLALTSSRGVPSQALVTSRSPGALTRAPIIPCSVRVPAPLAYVARLANGYGIQQASGLTYDAQPALVGTGSDLLVLRPRNGNGMVDPASAATNPALVHGGFLLPMSSDPAIRSCDLRAADVAAAHQYAGLAETSLVNGGLLTMDLVDASSTTVNVSDDPTTAGQLIVTVLLADPIPVGTDVSKVGSFVHAFGVVINRTTNAVVAMGRANWL